MSANDTIAEIRSLTTPNEAAQEVNITVWSRALQDARDHVTMSPAWAPAGQVVTNATPIGQGQKPI